MYISWGCYPQPFITDGLFYYSQHSFYTLAGAFGGKQRLCRFKSSSRALPALSDDALWLVKIIRSVNLGYIICFTAVKRTALMSGHMETHSPALDIAFYKIIYRRRHCHTSLWVSEKSKAESSSAIMARRILFLPLAIVRETVDLATPQRSAICSMVMFFM